MTAARHEHRVPLIATYRLQLTPAFGFDAARGLLDPLRRLGVSHLYLSPIAEAVPGSTHGYDVVDHRSVRAEFGGEEALFALLDAAEERGMGVVVDHVPNHVSVAVAEANPRWWAMLREGPESAAARWFDVDWELTGGKVIVPKLGDPLDDVVRDGAIEIVTGDDGPELHYGPLRFPMADGTGDLPLREALVAQHYELAWWRSPERNVRRFFTIDDLAAVRVEHDEIATAVDTIPAMLARHAAFSGVRIDHVDGLADPLDYLEGLRDRIGDRWIVVEKIVAPGETLPRSWPVAGTTGYEQITVAEHTLLDPAGREPFDALWARLAEAGEQDASFHELELDARREVLADGLRPDLDRLVRVASDHSPLPPDRLAAGLVELTLALDRYRTYLPGEASAEVLAEAVAVATARAPEHADAVAQVAELVRRHVDVRTRWQQLTGPVMAKGAEDRAFYRHQRLSSLCEVGGDPGGWTYDAATFHAHQQRVQAGWPETMLTSNTHDTKRSAAVRSRSLALATRPEAWSELVARWTAEHGDTTAGIRPPDVALALQTVVTAWPLDAERLGAFLVKAAREAELATSWTDPDDAYESRLGALADVLVDATADPDSPLGRTAAELAEHAGGIGLALLALQITCPGVPDLYQGAPHELLTLVDPDNRRPPDWSAWNELVDHAADDGPLDERTDRARAQLLHRVLRTRRRRPGAFDARAGYRPLPTGGADAADVIAFARLDEAGEPQVATIVVRPTSTPIDERAATVEIPDGRWLDLVADRDVDDGAIDVATVLDRRGVAVLSRLSG